MQGDQAILTIAIPTYNRAGYLESLLRNLTGQLAGDPRVELLVSDNASTDNTLAVVRECQQRYPQLLYKSNASNMGPDWNILQCFTLARTKYVWVFGDDDTLLPGGMQRVLQLIEDKDYDLIFLAPFCYRDDPVKEFRLPKINRPTEATFDVLRFARLVTRHSDLVYISSMIVNKKRITPSASDRFSEWIGTYLVQLGWVLTGLNQFRCGLFVELGIVGGKVDNSSGGFHAAKVFGENYARAVREWIRDNPKLRALLINDQLLLWFSNCWSSCLTADGMEDATGLLTPVFGNNFRYWLVVYPLLKLPRPLARCWAQVVRIPKAILRLWFRV
jgi:abequosyltransferase